MYQENSNTQSWLLQEICVVVQKAGDVINPIVFHAGLEHAMRKWKFKLFHHGVQLGHGNRFSRTFSFFLYHSYVHSCIYIQRHTHTYTYMYRHIHTHTYANIQIYLIWHWLFVVHTTSSPNSTHHNHIASHHLTSHVSLCHSIKSHHITRHDTTSHHITSHFDFFDFAPVCHGAAALLGHRG